MSGYFKHLIPFNPFGVTPPLNPVTGAYVLQDVSRGQYAQISASPAVPTIVGYVPATADGFGGITQLARDLNARFYNTLTTGFTASISGTTLTVNYPNVNVLWNGVIQTLSAGSINGTVTTGTWSLMVGYNWGLTNVTLVATSSVAPDSTSVEICQIQVDTTAHTATIQTGRQNMRLLETLGVASSGGVPLGSASDRISVSDGSGNMPW